MPKPSSFPTLFNKALQINISKLKGWGYLVPGQIKNGTINWSRDGNRTGSISIMANTRSEQPYIELDYKYRDEPRKYKVFLTLTRSNLNRGKIWYFICPVTKKRCRKLYSIGGYFLHREAFKGCLYETQTESKKYRELYKPIGKFLWSETINNEIYKKHFKKKYAGKPTKRYLRIMKKIQETESIPVEKINQFLKLL